MKNVIKNLFVLTFLLLLSCRDNNYSVIDYDSAIIYYKLDVCDEDKYYQTQEDNWKETIKVTKTIIAGDSIFAYKNITNAISFIKKNNLENRCGITITISIKKNNGKFEDIWVWKQRLYLAGEFSERFGRIEIETLKFQEFHQGIKITYKEGGFDLNILNYKYKDNYWILISRESLEIKPQIGIIEYCIDTINRNYTTKNKIIYLTNEYILDLEDKKCISNNVFLK